METPLVTKPQVDNKANQKERRIKLHKSLANPVVQSFIYGRSVCIVLLLIIQILLFLIFFLWFNYYIEYFLAIRLFASMLFLIFLINKKEKNEYKLMWLLPVIILPLFGISFYILVHFQIAMSKMKVRISQAAKTPKTRDANYYATNIPYAHIHDIVTYLKDTASFPPYTHTSIEYYPSGEAAFPEMIKALRHAKKFIFLEYFTLFPGQMWDTILDILLQKRTEGVEVRIMFDGFGCTPISPRNYQKYLKSIGLQHVAIFVPIIPIFAAYLNYRDHRKICVIDGKYAFTGGINLSDQYINKTHKYGYWKDTVVRIAGPAVRSFTDMFLDLWNIVTNTKADCKPYVDIRYKKYDVQGVVIPYSDNAYNDNDIAENVYYYIITQAKKYVHITTPYVILDNQLMNALVFASQRGVEVTILVPRTIDHYITFCTGRTFIKSLIDHGIRAYEFTPGFIHAKMFISDNTTAVVGSINLDYRSLYDHFEDAVFIYKNPVVAMIESDFQKTKAQCTEITAAVYKKIPLLQRMIGRLFKVFAPLL